MQQFTIKPMPTYCLYLISTLSVFFFKELINIMIKNLIKNEKIYLLGENTFSVNILRQ